jgi:hypothetical protein
MCIASLFDFGRISALWTDGIFIIADLRDLSIGMGEFCAICFKKKNLTDPLPSEEGSNE